MKKSILFKIAAVILAFSLVLILSVTSFAAKTVKMKIEIAGSDGLVYVRLTAPAASNISTISAALEYDSSKLAFKEMSYLDDPSIINSTNAENDGVVVANTVIAESLTEESKVFTYIFTVVEGSVGECEFSFADVKATDKNNNEINIVFDGSLKAEISSLEPLTPDKIQSSFDPAPESTSEPTSKPDKTENSDKPSIPNTAGKVIAVSAVSAAAAALIGITTAVIKKKRSEEN